MTEISSYNRVYKSNMTDVLDLPVLLKKNASTKYFRELEEKAHRICIIRGKGGIDKDNGIYFETEQLDSKGESIRYRFTFVFAFSTHSLDGLCVTE